jgi:hypothetical protein
MSTERDGPGDELAAMQRALAELGGRPLPGAVASRLDARLAAELGASPLAPRRSRRPLRIGASLSAAALVAAAVAVFAFGTGGGHKPGGEAAALRTTATPVAARVAADSAAKVAVGTATQNRGFAPKKACPPASRTGGGRPPAACPGARGGHARSV